MAGWEGGPVVGEEEWRSRVSAIRRLRELAMKVVGKGEDLGPA